MYNSNNINAVGQRGSPFLSCPDILKVAIGRNQIFDAGYWIFDNVVLVLGLVIDSVFLLIFH